MIYLTEGIVDAYQQGDNIFCKSPAASQAIRTRLDKLGYNLIGPTKLAYKSYVSWYARLRNIYFYACNTCNGVLPIMSEVHGTSVYSNTHRCMHCGAYTCSYFPPDSSFRFQFNTRSGNYGIDVRARVVAYDRASGELQLRLVYDDTEEERLMHKYLKRHRKYWRLVPGTEDGYVIAVQFKFSDSPPAEREDHVMKFTGPLPRQMHVTTVYMWNGRSYPDPNALPIGEMLDIYETWRTVL